VALVTGEYPPYTSEALPGSGATTRLVVEVFREAGIRTTVEFLPWKRVETTLQMGKAFGAFPYGETAERRAQYHFSDQLYLVRNAVAYCPANPRTPGPPPFGRPEDLAGYRVGVIAGSFAEPRLKAAGVEFEESLTVEMGLRKLKAGRIDYYIDDQATIEATALQLFPDSPELFRLLPRAFDEDKPNFLMVSRTYPGSDELLKKFNRALAALQNSGEFDRLLARLHLPRRGN
jgi:polar amino acid transport system substrate-binding protein